MNEQTDVPLQQLVTHANISQQLVPAADLEEATFVSKTAHQLPTSSHSMNYLWQCQSFVEDVRSQLIDSWQRQMEINKVKSEPFVSHSPFQRYETIATHATLSMRPLQLMPQQSETIVPHSTKQSETIRTCSTNQIK